jgi:hypothetical protein
MHNNLFVFADSTRFKEENTPHCLPPLVSGFDVSVYYIVSYSAIVLCTSRRDDREHACPGLTS